MADSSRSCTANLFTAGRAFIDRCARWAERDIRSVRARQQCHEVPAKHRYLWLYHVVRPVVWDCFTHVPCGKRYVVLFHTRVPCLHGNTGTVSHGTMLYCISRRGLPLFLNLGGGGGAQGLSMG